MRSTGSGVPPARCSRSRRSRSATSRRRVGASARRVRRPRRARAARTRRGRATRTPACMSCSQTARPSTCCGSARSSRGTSSTRCSRRSCRLPRALACPPAAAGAGAATGSRTSLRACTCSSVWCSSVSSIPPSRTPCFSSSTLLPRPVRTCACSRVPRAHACVTPTREVHECWCAGCMCECTHAAMM